MVSKITVSDVYQLTLNLTKNINHIWQQDKQPPSLIVVDPPTTSYCTVDQLKVKTQLLYQ